MQNENAAFTARRKVDVKSRLSTQVIMAIQEGWYKSIDVLPLTSADRQLAKQMIRRICSPASFSFASREFEKYFRYGDEPCFGNINIANMTDLLLMLCHYQTVAVDSEFWRDFVCSIEVALAEDGFTYVPVSMVHCGDNEARPLINSSGDYKLPLDLVEDGVTLRPIFDAFYPTVCIGNKGYDEVCDLTYDYTEGCWCLDANICYGPKASAVQRAASEISASVAKAGQYVMPDVTSWYTEIVLGTRSFKLNPFEVISVMINIASSDRNFAPHGCVEIHHALDGRVALFDKIIVSNFEMTGSLPIDYRAINNRVRSLLAEIGVLDYRSRWQDEIPY